MTSTSEGDLSNADSVTSLTHACITIHHLKSKLQLEKIDKEEDTNALYSKVPNRRPVWNKQPIPNKRPAGGISAER